MSSQLPNFSRTNRPPATSVAGRRRGRYNDATTSIHPSSPPPTYASGAGSPLSRHQHDTEDDGVGVKAATTNAAQQAASRLGGLGSHDRRPPPPRARLRTPSVSNASSFCRRLRNESAIRFSPVDLDLALVELASVDELSLIESYEKEISASRHTSLDVAASAAPLSHVYRSSSTQTEMGRRTRQLPASPTAVATSGSSPGHPVRMHLYPHSERGEEVNSRGGPRPAHPGSAGLEAPRPYYPGALAYKRHHPHPRRRPKQISSGPTTSSWPRATSKTGPSTSPSVRRRAPPRPLPLDLKSPTSPLIHEMKSDVGGGQGSPSTPEAKAEEPIGPDDEMSELPTGFRFYMIVVSLLLCVFLMSLDLKV
ncbi:hypothetical protein PG997_014124 [Apiospora hydei]|uniref:Uncharacterized protein n=1 Tax=Apiospora hydei TaxID=1337664 RepID=A0ABR1V871_9PEZI